MPPWKTLIKPDQVDIVSPEGDVRCRVAAYYSGSMFVIDDMNVDVRAGDEIRRRLPNGNEEAFHVDDPAFFDTGRFGKHYQVKVSRPKTYPPHSGGNYSISINGENARVNIQSTDASINFVQKNSVFDQARQLVSSSGLNSAKAAEVTAHIESMESAKSQTTFADAYHKFIASTADHIAIFAPILTALATALAAMPPG